MKYKPIIRPLNSAAATAASNPKIFNSHNDQCSVCVLRECTVWNGINTLHGRFTQIRIQTKISRKIQNHFHNAQQQSTDQWSQTAAVSAVCPLNPHWFSTFSIFYFNDTIYVIYIAHILLSLNFSRVLCDVFILEQKGIKPLNVRWTVESVC